VAEFSILSAFTSYRIKCPMCQLLRQTVGVGGGSCSGRMPRFSFMGRDAGFVVPLHADAAIDVASFPASSE